MAKLIIIEGLDGCGKSTQTALLEEYFQSESIDYKKIKLPDYDSPSSTLVKMYLGGAFGKNADDVNAYAAGAFYAVDRYASFKLGWSKDYKEKDIILADRYATSNSIYQMEKLDKSQWDEYLECLPTLNITKSEYQSLIWLSIWICRLRFLRSL